MNTLENKESSDHVTNYARQVIQMGLMLMNLNDTEREGDGECIIINWKVLLLYFRARKRGQKYAYEAMRFLSHVKALFSEKMAHRATHGRVLNHLGGTGRNVANDLKQEHYVKKNKKLITKLGAQKTLKAVSRVTGASNGIEDININLEHQAQIHRPSSKHTVASAEEDEKEMVKILRGLKPFHSVPNRKHPHFPSISESPMDELDVMLLKTWLTRHRNHLAVNRNAEYEAEETNEDDNGMESDDEESNPEEDIALREDSSDSSANE